MADEKTELLRKAAAILARSQAAQSPAAIGVGAAAGLVDRARQIIAGREKADLASQEQMISEAEDNEPVGAGERVKLSFAAKDQTVADFYKKLGAEVTTDSNGNLIIRRKGEKAKHVDKPSSLTDVARAGAAAIAGPMLPGGPLAAYVGAGEGWRERLGDVADTTGAVVESLPGAIAQLAMRGRGGALASILGGAGADFGGSAARQYGAAKMLGEELTAGERAGNIATNVVLGGAGELASRGLQALANAPKKYLAKKMLGNMPAEEVAAVAKSSKAAGAQLTPAGMSLSPNALGLESLLRQSPGQADNFLAFDLKNVMGTSRVADSAITRASRESVPPEVAGDMVAGGLQKHFDAIDTARKSAFARLVDPHKARVTQTASGQAKSAELRELGFNVPTIPDKMTIEEFQKRLHDVGDIAMGKKPILNAQRTDAQWAASELKKAMLDDLAVAAKDPSLADAAEALTKARGSYAKLSAPINEAMRERIIPALLGRANTEQSQFVIRDLAARGTYSEAQVAKVFAVLDKIDPLAARSGRRAVVDAILEPAMAGGKHGLPEGVGLLEKAAARQASGEGVTALLPGKARDALRKNFDRVSTLFKGDRKTMAELRNLIDTFDRMDASMGYLKGSPTAPLIMHQDAIRAVANLLQSPLRSAQEIGLMAYKTKLSAAITNDDARNALIGLTRTTPNTNAAAVSALVAKLTNALGREEMIGQEP